MAKRKEKRVVVITGASSGIGRELKAMFEAAGDDVLGLSRTSCGEGWRECDVTDSERVRAAIDAIGREYGRIDILINNAGVGISGAIELTEDDDYEKVMKTNVDGVFNVSRAAIKYMKRGSKIVNISSVCALFSLPFRSLYCAAKAAVNMLSFGMRMELKSSGISVVAVCPGEIKTGFTKHRIKNFATSERYGDRIERATESIDRKEDKRMDCKDACKKIYRIATKKRGAMYIIGFKYKLLNFVSRLVPVGAMVSATGSLMGGK